MTEAGFAGDVALLFDALPDRISGAVVATGRSDRLVEVVMDLGRPAEARFDDGMASLGTEPVTADEIAFVTSNIGEFGDDNRAGIEKTLHRISAIRNRRGTVVGLTCRVGRAVYGTIDIISDLLGCGGILIMGPPGVGKTTMLREMARVIAENKRVVIVDTSNEIAGDGDVPHPGIGRARRMQVPHPDRQHAVMIEAVENHMPEVIVVDEIGVLEETYAARTIAERGVQLIATAHGNTLENLVQNPTLSELLGGIESVTLSDEEARKRRTQKTVLERKSPPAFDVLVEIRSRGSLIIHRDLAHATDMLLRGMPFQAENRVRTESGEIRSFSVNVEPESARPLSGTEDAAPEFRAHPSDLRGREDLRIYPYGISRNHLENAILSLGSTAIIVRDPDEADLVLTLKSRAGRSGSRLNDAISRRLPVFSIRSNTIAQIQSFISENLM